ncbi:MAG TPA: DUF4439 domain-containing protein [Thermoleophilaceae bacterium]|nr:DUF4439 domain-containing protein [Thermoleophilaceae bacterium]
MSTSRRGFIRLTATVGGSTLLMSACGSDDTESKGDSTAITGEGDVQHLNAVLDLEHTAVAAYTMGTTLLEAPALGLAQSFLRHEQVHAAELTKLVRDLGGTPHQAKSTQEYARGFPAMMQPDDVLRFAVRLERDALRAYLDSGPRLTDPRMRQTAAAIATVQAGHLAVLLAALGEPPVSGAFALGEESA